MSGLTITENGIETGPVDEEEQGSNHGNHLTVVITCSASLFVFESFLSTEEVGACEAEVGAEHVDGHSTTDVVNVEYIEYKDSVQGEEEGFKSGEEHHLGERNFT